MANKPSLFGGGGEAPRLAELIEEAAERFGLARLAEDLEALRAPAEALTVALVGEFSAGKSTLLNALLRRKLLPEDVEPTTAALCLVEVLDGLGEQEQRYFELDEEGERRPSDAVRFCELAEGVREGGTPLVQVAPRGPLRPGWVFVDTPGLQSVEELHEGITLGVLPRVDAFVLVVDARQGGLRRSQVDFLRRPEVAALAEHLVVAVAKADSVPASDLERVVAKVAADLEAALGAERLGGEAAARVVAVSAKRTLEAGDEDGVAPLERLLEEAFVARRAALEATRRRKALLGLAERAERLLVERREGLGGDDGALRDKERGLREEVQRLGEERGRLEREVRRRLERLRDELLDTALGYTERLLQEPAQAREAAEQLAADLAAAAERHAAKLQETVGETLRLGGGELGEAVAGEAAALAEQMEAIRRTLSTIILVATAAWLGPARGAANAAEAGVAVLAKTAGEKWKGLGEVLRRIDPGEVLTRLGMRLVGRPKLEAALRDGAERMARQLERRVMDELVEPTLARLEREAEERLDNLRRLEEERKRAAEERARLEAALQEAAERIGAAREALRAELFGGTRAPASAEDREEERDG